MYKIKSLYEFIQESIVTDEERKWLTYIDEMGHHMKTNPSLFIEGARHFGFPDVAIQDALADGLGIGLEEALAMMDATNEGQITFQDLYQSKNKWIQMYKNGDRKKIADNLFVLIDNSYSLLGGHPSVKKLDDIFDSRLTYWEAADIDIDPEADTVIFGRKSPYGFKISGMGHDGLKKSRSELMKKLHNVLMRPGYWIEASDRVAEILYKMGTPYLDEESDVQVIFKDAHFLDDKGWYRREVAKNKKHTETIFGRPLLRGK